MELERPIIRMPGFGEGEWLQSKRPLTRDTLRGQVVLVDFWDYSCINCLRTLPYLARWHERYYQHGLTIIGVHTPEFQFAHVREQVETAVADYQIRYPILLDNQYETWTRFANKAWPTKYLVDPKGYIRLKRQGEGYYRDVEQSIQTLLRQKSPQLQLPDLLPPLRDEDAPGSVCYRPTPELYAGYQGGLFSGGLGNREGYMPKSSVFYRLPDERVTGQFYADGAWKAWPEAFAYAGKSGGRLILPYSAVDVNAVMGPTADPVETRLNLRPTDAEPIVEIKQNGRYLSFLQAGSDVEFSDEGVSFVRVTRPRMYHLIQNVDYQTHELELIFRATGLALYTFTFTTCLAPPTADNETLTIY